MSSKYFVKQDILCIIFILPCVKHIFFFLRMIFNLGISNVAVWDFVQLLVTGIKLQ